VGKNIYSYIFYKLYKFYEAAPSKWLSDWKALCSLIVLEIWCLITIMVYYKVFTKKDLISDNNLTATCIIVVILLTGFNYSMFMHQNRWKRDVKKFDAWPAGKNRKGAIFVLLLILLILGNFVFSFYLMSQVNWKQFNN
jgi:hypothetical protein